MMSVLTLLSARIFLKEPVGWVEVLNLRHTIFVKIVKIYQI